MSAFTGYSGAAHTVTVPRAVPLGYLRTRLSRTLFWDIGSFSGSLSTFAPRNPSAVGEWSSFAGEFREFRVLAMSVTVGFPHFVAAPPSYVAVPLVCVFGYINDNTAPPNTVPQAIGFSAVVQMDPNGLQRANFKLPKTIASTSGVGSAYIETDWCATAVPSAVQGGVFNVIDVLGASGTSVLNARVTVEFDCEFRYRY